MRRFIVISLLAVVVTASVQIPIPASAATPRVLIVDGHGWGHGRGMGQYGARAQAEGRATWQQILSRYYTGIRLERRSTAQRIRVLLKQTRSVVVRADYRLTATWTTGKTLTRRVHAYFWIGRVGVATVIKASSSPTGPWHTFASGRSRIIRLEGAKQVGIIGSSSARWYRGAIDLLPSGSTYDVIDDVPLEQYVAEVVPREMPASWPINALRAQAVAARTYVLRVAEVARSRHSSHDICGSDACQVFGGYAWTVRGSYEVLENRRTNAAALSTAGYIMTWHGKAILAEYSSSTGGYTTSGGTPYLAPRPDPWDLSSPYHAWSETVDMSQIQSHWPSVGSVRSVQVIARDGRGDFGGRARTLLISGSRRSIRIPATSFQYAFGLPSDWFRLLASTGQYRFTFNLSYGTHNAAVRFLQERLRSAGFFPKTAPLSSYFGPITRDSLQRYQRAQRINATGFLGPMTRARLNASAS
jgi:stage II sporulation protein D